VEGRKIAIKCRKLEGGALVPINRWAFIVLKKKKKILKKKKTHHLIFYKLSLPRIILKHTSSLKKIV
jgi:hypothetical protein